MTLTKTPQQNLEFKCSECTTPVSFSALDHSHLSKTLTCQNCQKQYLLGAQILEQLKQFEALCRQIQLSKSIFGQSAVAVDVGPHQVKIPFQLLLTRLSSILELSIGGEKTTIAFRVDTLKGVAISK